MGNSIEEEIGATIEDLVYKAVGFIMMSILLTSLHGMDVMKHSDIRYWNVNSWSPPVPKAIYSASSNDYACGAIG